MSRSLRAGLAARLSWLADDNPNKAFELTLEKIAVGTKRPGNRTKKTGVGVQTGRALASVVPGEWGGLDFLAGDAMVAEYTPLDRAAWLKDDKDARTRGVKPWEEGGDHPNMRLALPLEGVMTRASKIGQGFEFEHVLFLNRAHLIAHHRPDDPPINSTEISDPGMGAGDWTAGLHSLARVRPWLDDFCQSRSTSSADPSKPLYSALLNFTRSAGDNTGWGGAHFATAEAVLSAEAFGFAHPADDGQHRLGRPDVVGAADILQGGLHITRTLYGDTKRGILYSPAEFVNLPWRSGAKGPFIQRVEWREDFAATHGTRCGSAQGTKKWMSWSPFREYGPPPSKPPHDDPPEEPPGKPRDPTMLVPPESPRPSVTTPDEIEAPSEYGHPIPNGPDAPGSTDWPESGYSNDGPAYATFADEVDALWTDRYKFTEREFNTQPITGHGIWHAQYENATAADGKQERWRPVKSQLEELSFDDDGWITGRTAALGPGGKMYAGSDVLLHDTYTTINAPKAGEYFNEFSLAVFSAWSSEGGGEHVAEGEIGIGSLKPNTWGVVKGLSIQLDFTRQADADHPDVIHSIVDEEGADSATANHQFNQTVKVTTGSGDVDILDVETEATNDNPRTRVYQARTTSTNENEVTLHTFSLATAGTYRIRATIMGRATVGGTGSSVTTGDSVGYEVDATFKNVGGTVTQVGSTTKDVYEDASMGAADCRFQISSTNVTLDVSGVGGGGDTDDEYVWHMPWSRFAGPMAS